MKLKSYACLRYVRILGKRASSLRDYASNTSDQHQAECNFTVLLRVKISKSVDVHYAGRKRLHPALPTRHAQLLSQSRCIVNKEHGPPKTRCSSFVQTPFNPAHKGMHAPTCWHPADTHIYYKLVSDIYNACECLSDFCVWLLLETRKCSQYQRPTRSVRTCSPHSQKSQVIFTSLLMRAVR